MEEVERSMEPEPKDFLEHFDFTRRVTTNKAKITHKILNLKHLWGPPRLNLATKST